ncbi:DUF1830 domain-containing protein [Kamptonema sp. UHCC 0994]|uniref:DUF1830 domain-containing protein n=1 Tax=Kamptonema sp. UHCC 0994 TaxID=3031329 RepID=UPI0023B8A9D5|nr:DUF1830 domain-containing protein [Kamptonema sp. UHCC 0994]MDF0552782.1 DUF1830 domain-containing protein [Kamptonema sp. UHCC 0994]
MTLTLDRLPSDLSGRILCWYINDTSTMQIARIANIANWYFERTVFPGERLLFEALPEAELEIWQSVETGAVAFDKFLCDELRVEEETDSVV